MTVESLQKEFTMKYYESHEQAYKKLKENNFSFWGESKDSSETFENFYMKEYLERVLALIKPVAKTKVLEIGCGTGPASCLLAKRGYDVDGFDVSETAIEIARVNAKNRNLNINYSVNDICTISEINSGTYDVVIDGHCMHCITYDSDRHAALSNVFRLLKKGGYFIVDTMSKESSSDWPHPGRVDENGIIWHNVKEDYPYEKVEFEGKYWICTRRVRSISDLRNELKQSGFMIEQIEIHEDEEIEEIVDFRAICRKP